MSSPQPDSCRATVTSTGAVRVARRRLELLDTLPVGPLSGFEFGDGPPGF